MNVECGTVFLEESKIITKILYGTIIFLIIKIPFKTLDHHLIRFIRILQRDFVIRQGDVDC